MPLQLRIHHHTPMTRALLCVAIYISLILAVPTGSNTAAGFDFGYRVFVESNLPTADSQGCIPNDRRDNVLPAKYDSFSAQSGKCISLSEILEALSTEVSSSAAQHTPPKIVSLELISDRIQREDSTTLITYCGDKCDGQAVVRRAERGKSCLDYFGLFILGGCHVRSFKLLDYRY
ncbi:hypothetical protein V8F20_004317 [Naviculisporaceae sp. PSN 640]